MEPFVFSVLQKKSPQIQQSVRDVTHCAVRTKTFKTFVSLAQQKWHNTRFEIYTQYFLIDTTDLTVGSFYLLFSVVIDVNILNFNHLMKRFISFDETLHLTFHDVWLKKNRPALQNWRIPDIQHSAGSSGNSDFFEGIRRFWPTLYSGSLREIIF